MKSWPNILNLILLAIIILMFLGVLDTRKSVQATDQILGFMKQTKARAALVVDENNKVSIINEKGEAFEEKCSIGPKGEYKQCRGFAPGGTVLDMQTYNVVRAKGSNCIEFIGGDGRATEYCWD